MSGLGLGIASLAIGVGTTALSFGQAGSQKKLMDRANKKAAEQMAKARQRLEVNYMDDLDINKEQYNIERDNVLQATAAATQAGMEGDARGAAATAGRVTMGTQAGQRQVRASQEAEVNRLAELSAKEDARLRDLNLQLDMGEIQGAQQAASDAQAARSAAMQQGFTSLGQTVQQGLALVPLFAQNVGAQKQAVGDMQFTPEQFEQFGNVKGLGEAGEGFTNVDFEAISQMSNKDFRAFKDALNTDQYNMLFGSQQYQDAFGRYKPKGFENVFGMQYGAASLGGEE